MRATVGWNGQLSIFWFYFIFAFAFQLRPTHAAKRTTKENRHYWETTNGYKAKYKKFCMPMLPQGVIVILIAIKSSSLISIPYFAGSRWMLACALRFVTKSTLCFSSLRRSRQKQQLRKKSAPKEFNSLIWQATWMESLNVQLVV
jgi:hypothetical protein